MKKSYKAGERVFLAQTGESVIVRRILNDGWAYVLLDGDEIPVPFEELSNEQPAIKDENHSTEKKLSPQENKIPAAPIKQTEKSARSQQVLLCFEPIMSGNETSSFKIYLINELTESCTFEYAFYLNDESIFSLKKIVLPNDSIILHEIDYDALNQRPAFEIIGRDIFNKHFHFDYYQKIKPQNFFNKKENAFLLSKEAFVYKIPLEKISHIPKPKTTEKISVNPDELRIQMQETSPSKIREVEAPVSEIDLHIEALTNEYRSMPRDEKLQFQIRSFQQSLERAVAHHQRELFVIHGIGSGKLKQEIHRILRNYPHVKSFNNNYHPRYGFGATEIIFQ